MDLSRYWNLWHLVAIETGALLANVIAANPAVSAIVLVH